VLGEIVIATCCNAHEFLRSKWELEGDVRAGLGVVGELVTLVDIPTEQFLPNSNIQQELVALVHPLLVVRGPHIGPRWDKVLDLHLLELPGAEDEVPRRDLVPERLADLGDPERDLLPRRCQDVFEIEEDPLRRFWAQVGGGALVREGPHLRLEHQIEGPGHGEGGPPGRRTGDLLHGSLIGIDQILELKRRRDISLAIQAFQKRLGLPPRRLHHVGIVPLLHAHVADAFTAAVGASCAATTAHDDDFGIIELIGAEPELGFLAIHHGIGKAIDVA
jgi:hypothetical protein